MSDFDWTEYEILKDSPGLHAVEKARMDGDGGRYQRCCCYFDDDNDGLPVTMCNHHKVVLDELRSVSAENSRLAAKEEYALGHLEQALTIEKELRADVAARDDLLNEMCNVLQIISDGRNAAGSKIDRALYAETAHECLNDEWARVSTEPKRDLFEEIKEGLEAVRDSQNGNKADVSPKTAIEKDGINDRGSDEYANPDTGIVDYE